MIAGPKGWLRRGTRSARRTATLGDRVGFTGPVARPLRALYRGADLFALPSRHEGFGLPVVEAMAQGTAVICCSDIPVLREIAGDAATYTPVGDVDVWADQRSKVSLMTTPDVLAARRRAARTRSRSPGNAAPRSTSRCTAACSSARHMACECPSWLVSLRGAG